MRDSGILWLVIGGLATYVFLRYLGTGTTGTWVGSQPLVYVPKGYILTGAQSEPGQPGGILHAVPVDTNMAQLQALAAYQGTIQ